MHVCVCTLTCVFVQREKGTEKERKHGKMLTFGESGEGILEFL